MVFWSGRRLKQELPDLVSDYDEDRVDCAAYTLRMGYQYYVSASEADAGRNTLQTLQPEESLAIPSGQFAVLLTEETVTVPPGKIAFISIKTTLKSRGLVNVSGFHVDPGYSAPLRFAVFNAGPSTIVITRREDCFLIWYADLDVEDTENVKSAQQNRRYSWGISSNDVASLAGAVNSVGVLSQKVEKLERNVKIINLFGLVLSVVAALIIAIIASLANEGVKSFIAETTKAVIVP